MYIGICCEAGNTIEEKNAFGYALSRILASNEEQQEFIDWYYSGNWIKTDEGDE